MNVKQGLLFIILLLLNILTGKAQFVDLGQDPAFLRWRQIKTEDFQLIYPDYFEENAQKIANIYTALYRHANSLEHRPPKISMIIHTQGGISNGSVTWAPKRSDLYATPQQEPSDDWLEHLCVHEFRHVVQIDKVNQGFTNFLYHFFGEQVVIAVIGVYVPQWFLEGDAVCFETAVGNIGRGRSPEFLNEMKAQILEKGIYTYYKAVLGSYKDYVPNQYMMGYYMVANSRVNYGNAIWSDALDRVGRRPLGIVPFAKSLKLTMATRRDSLWNDSTFRSLFLHPDSVKNANTYGDAKRTLYHDNFTELQQRWKREIEGMTGNFDTIPTANKYYANYYYPTPVSDGRLLVYKKGFRETGAFILLKEGKEKLLLRPGLLDDNKFAFSNGRIVWAEYRPALRWEHGGQMVLASSDISEKNYKRHKSRHNRFSPFAAGEEWGCVEVDNNNRASIIILDRELKNERLRIPAGKEELFIHPYYQNHRIFTVVQSPEGIRLESIDIQSGKREKITPELFYELDNPVQLDSMLIFRASFNRNNSFYLKNLQTGTTRNIVNAPFGVNFPALNNSRDSLYFSFYTANGYKPAKVSIRDFTNKPVEMEQFYLADSLEKSEKWKLRFDTDSLYATRKYNKFTHLVNIHSWGPLYIGMNDQKVDLGLVVYSQNKLSTLSFTAGYILKSGFENGAWLFNASYKGWWPTIDLNLESGRYNYNAYTLKAENIHSQKNDTLIYRNKSALSSADITVRLPFNLSAGNFNRTLRPFIRYKIEALHNTHIGNVQQYTIQDEIPVLIPADKQNYRIPTASEYYQLLEYGLTFNNQSRMTTQEINPRWGQILEAGYTHTPWKKINLGYQWWTTGSFYFPGLFKNHTLAIYLGHQQSSESGAYYYDNKIRAPRGIKLYGDQISTLRSNYKLPLLFPDLHISSLLYIKGIDGGIFFDMAEEKYTYETYRYHSYGVELTADTHFFRLPFPVNMGIRTGYESQTKSMFANFLFSIGLSI